MWLNTYRDRRVSHPADMHSVTCLPLSLTNLSVLMYCVIRVENLRYTLTGVISWGSRQRMHYASNLRRFTGTQPRLQLRGRYRESVVVDRAVNVDY